METNEEHTHTRMHKVHVSILSYEQLGEKEHLGLAILWKEMSS